MSELKFASTEEALQHLSDVTGKRIKIADDSEFPASFYDEGSEFPEGQTLEEVFGELVNSGSHKEIAKLIDNSKFKATNMMIHQALESGRSDKECANIVARLLYKVNSDVVLDDMLISKLTKMKGLPEEDKAEFFQNLSDMSGKQIKVASSGYVEESLESALNSIGLANGGMDYRVNDKDGSLSLDHDEVEKVRSAMSSLDEAKKMVMQARSNLQGIDLGYTGKGNRIASDDDDIPSLDLDESDMPMKDEKDLIKELHAIQKELQGMDSEYKALPSYSKLTNDLDTAAKSLMKFFQELNLEFYYDDERQDRKDRGI